MPALLMALEVWKRGSKYADTIQDQRIRTTVFTTGVGLSASKVAILRDEYTEKSILELGLLYFGYI